MSVSHQLLQIQGQYAKYWIGGTGPTLVLLHGPYGDARHQWRDLLERLSDQFHVVAPDLPGFGVSDALALPTYQSFLSWLNHFFALLNIGGPIRLIGHSFGAALARLYTAENTSYVARLILIDGGHIADKNGCVRLIFRTPIVSSLLFGLTRQTMYSVAGLRRAFYTPDTLTAEHVIAARAAAQGYLAALRAIGTMNAPALVTPTCPTLVVWGEFDRIQPIGLGRAIAAQIPGARFAVVGRSGHLPQIEQPGDFEAAITPFLHGG